MRRSRAWSVVGVAPLLLLCCASLAAGAVLPSATPREAAVTPPVRLEALSCPTAIVCVALGTDANGAPVFFRTTDGAATWTPQAVPPGTPTGYPREGLSCATAAQCLAFVTGERNGIASVLYTAFIETTDGGSKWSTRPVDNFGGSNATDPTCAAPVGCYVIRDTSSVIRSTNGGASWKAVPGSGWPPPACGGCSSAGFDDLSCVRASTTCFAVGRSAATAFEFGATSHAGARLDRTTLLSNVRGRGGYLVSCASVHSCMVVNLFSSRVLTTSSAGAQWVSRSLPTSVDAVHALSCGTTNECVALVHERTHRGLLLAATTRNDGLSWSIAAVSPAPSALWTASISCPNATRCYVDGPAATPDGSVYVRVGPNARWVRKAVS